MKKVKSDKILEIIPRLENLSKEDLDTVEKAIDSCIVVQALKKINNKDVFINN